MNAKLSFLLITTAILALGLLGVCHGGPLKQNYYKHTCPQALKIVRKVTWKHVAQDLTVAAPLLRLHFHDCFVRVILVSLRNSSLANIVSYICFSYKTAEHKHYRAYIVSVLPFMTN